VARRTIATRPVEVTGTGHLTEFLYDDGENDETLVCAGHGGAVEPGTAEAAIELVTGRPGTSCWATLGYDAEVSAFDRWHPPSTRISPDEYPLLEEIADRGFETVLSLHGLADEAVIVGGGIDAGVKRRVAERLEGAFPVPVTTAGEGEYAGVHPENFVNWLADGDGGLQLELGPSVRNEYVTELQAELGSLLESELRRSD
jgi:phage replication-related protein YjqB (UPF0714/DUF867 family)